MSHIAEEELRSLEINAICFLEGDIADAVRPSSNGYKLVLNTRLPERVRHHLRLLVRYICFRRSGERASSQDTVW